MRIQSVRVAFDDDEDMKDIVVQLWHDGYSGSVVNYNTIEVLVDERLDVEDILDKLATYRMEKIL